MNSKDTGGKWQEIKYKETFDDEIRGLIRRKQSNPGCKIEDLQGILKSLYIIDGQNHEGRGAVGDIVMAATIAAYEQFISNWKEEIL